MARIKNVRMELRFLVYNRSPGRAAKDRTQKQGLRGGVAQITSCQNNVLRACAQNARVGLGQQSAQVLQDEEFESNWQVGNLATT